MLFGDKQRYFPTRQFHQDRILAGLPAILAALAAGPGGEQTWAMWLAAPTYGDLTGLEHLRAGHLEMLLTEARDDVRRWNH